jgi:hypothetical protein
MLYYVVVLCSNCSFAVHAERPVILETIYFKTYEHNMYAYCVVCFLLSVGHMYNPPSCGSVPFVSNIP